MDNNYEISGHYQGAYRLANLCARQGQYFEAESLIRKAFEKRLNVDRDLERKIKAMRHI